MKKVKFLSSIFVLIVALFSVSFSASAAVNNTFIKPTEGTFTQYYNAGVHYGVDIAKSGTVKVVASAAGTVSKSYLSSSYGNVIFIKHTINGQSFETVYAHLSSRAVSAGDTVYQGQFIGYMGATGDATGQHLHFEIHSPYWTDSKQYAVDPMNYIPTKEGHFKSGSFTYDVGTDNILAYPISYGGDGDLSLELNSSSATGGTYTVYLQRSINGVWTNVAHTGAAKNGQTNVTFTKEYNNSTLYQYTPYRLLLVNNDTTSVSYSLWIK